MQDSPPRPSPDHKKTKLEPGDAFSFDFDGSGVIGFPGFAEKWIPEFPGVAAVPDLPGSSSHDEIPATQPTEPSPIAMKKEPTNPGNRAEIPTNPGVAKNCWCCPFEPFDSAEGDESQLQRSGEVEPVTTQSSAGASHDSAYPRGSATLPEGVAEPAPKRSARARSQRVPLAEPLINRTKLASFKNAYLIAVCGEASDGSKLTHGDCSICCDNSLEH